MAKQNPVKSPNNSGKWQKGGDQWRKPVTRKPTKPPVQTYDGDQYYDNFIDGNGR